MGSKSKGVEETAQQRALADHAMNQLQDYKRRWLPVQKRMAEQVQAAGEADSFERRSVAGRASTDNAVKFAGAQGALEKAMSNNVGMGSSRAKLAVAGLNDDQSASKGFGMTLADQSIDDAYTKGLAAIAAQGRGERGQVAESMTAQANASGRQASADAESALTERMGTARVVGQVAGLGMQQGMGSLGKQGTGGVTGTNDIAGVNGSNAVDKWLTAGVGGD